METRFVANNTHLEGAKTFAQTDPHLKRLYTQPYVYHSDLINELPREPSIVTLGGGRQVGKSTLLKQWMEDLLQSGVPAEAICFYSGELVGDYQSLYGIMKKQIASMPKGTIKYFILDEVTDIPDWDKTIKYLADTNELEEVVLVLSGSDLVLIQDARKRFPGRRGRARKVNFHYYPLSFRELLHLQNKAPSAEELESGCSESTINNLYSAWNEYLIHGGFLTAINDYANFGSIPATTLEIYSDWIRGDVLKRNKNENYLQEIIGAIIKHYVKQVSWDNLVKELSIDHTQTVSDYMQLLGSMDAVFIQSAIIEDKLVAAPKKRKKLIFCDPFIYHAMRAWLDPVADPFQEQIMPLLSEPQTTGDLVESAVIAHFRRFFPTYYIKAEGEIDVAYIDQKRFWPVELKWTNQLRSKDLKQIQKYSNSVIYAKTMQITDTLGIPTLPLPLAVFNIDALADKNR